MADLAARPRLLPVQVHASTRVGGHQVVQPLVDRHRGGRTSEHVGHHDDRRGRRCVAERVVEHGAQVLLELRGTGTLDRPMC
jgi:hypothetical protein